MLVRTAARLIDKARGSSIGVYRTTLLPAQAFGTADGTGRHPAKGLLKAQYMSFAYEVIDLTAPTGPVRGYFCSRPWPPEPAAHGRIADGGGRGKEPRTAYALVSGVWLGRRRAVVKPSAQPQCQELKRRPGL